MEVFEGNQVIYILFLFMIICNFIIVLDMKIFEFLSLLMLDVWFFGLCEGVGLDIIIKLDVVIYFW